jgi:hypothetical protein
MSALACSAFVTLDNLTSSDQTQHLLGWQPTHPGHIDDLDHGHYVQDRP